MPLESGKGVKPVSRRQQQKIRQLEGKLREKNREISRKEDVIQREKRKPWWRKKWFR
jgi:hypothetical protein